MLLTEESRAMSAEASLDAAKLNLAGGTMTGDINMSNNGIENVNYFELTSFQALAVQDAGDLSLVNNKITDLAAPTNDGDATNKLYVDTADQSLAAALSSEISRAEAAEDSLEVALSSEVSYLLANTDLTSIDSFAEVSDTLTAEVSTRQSIDEAIKAGVNAALVEIKTMIVRAQTRSIFKIKSNFEGDGVETTFNIVNINPGGVHVYLNGLLQSDGDDYTFDDTYVDGNGREGISFIFNQAPSLGSKIIISSQDNAINDGDSPVYGGDFTPLV